MSNEELNDNERTRKVSDKVNLEVVVEIRRDRTLCRTGRILGIRDQVAISELRPGLTSFDDTFQNRIP